MKKIMSSFVTLVVALMLVAPNFVSAAPIGDLQLNPDFKIDPKIINPTINLPPAEKILSCEVEGTNKLVGLNNEITYRVKYTSNYSLLNADYRTVLTPVVSTHVAPMLASSKGATSFVKGSGYITLQGQESHTFSYKASSYSRVRLDAQLEGVPCKGKIFNTIKPIASREEAIAVIAEQNVQPTLPQIDLTNLRVTTTINPPAQEEAAQPEAQEYTCSVIIEGLPLDEDTILIGAAIRYSSLQAGKYNYSLRGYRSDQNVATTVYSDTTTVEQNTKNGLVFDKDDKAFFFTYDSKSSADAYMIMATLGNTDCSAVVLPSLLLDEEENDDVQVAATNSPARSNDNDSSDGDAAVAGENRTESNGVVAIGPTQEEREEGDALNLLEKTGAAEVQAALETSNEEEDDIAPANNTNTWDSSDYAITGLLGAILIALVGYGIMKYRGLM